MQPVARRLVLGAATDRVMQQGLAV